MAPDHNRAELETSETRESEVLAYLAYMRTINHNIEKTLEEM